jgi:hypothetical protein
VTRRDASPLGERCLLGRDRDGHGKPAVADQAASVDDWAGSVDAAALASGPAAP